MKTLLKNSLKLILGYAILGFSIAMSYNSNMGLAPWNVLNDGFANLLPITIGQASMAVGVVIIALDILMKEPIGFGSLFNILCIGPMSDFFIGCGLIPSAETAPMNIILLVLSIPVNAIGLYFYMSAGMGNGPRDTLMVAVTKRTKFPVGLCRNGLEAVALLSGWLLGGKVGIGTVILVIFSGPVMQYIFKLFKFDVKKVNNQTFIQTIRMVSADVKSRSK